MAGNVNFTKSTEQKRNEIQRKKQVDKDKKSNEVSRIIFRRIAEEWEEACAGHAQNSAGHAQNSAGHAQNTLYLFVDEKIRIQNHEKVVLRNENAIFFFDRNNGEWRERETGLLHAQTVCSNRIDYVKQHSDRHDEVKTSRAKFKI